MKGYVYLFTLIVSFFSFSQERKKIHLKKYQISFLSNSLVETSGLSFSNNKLLTLNDSGNPNEVYEINPTDGIILNKIQTDLPNTDWEAISYHKDTLYIGDFGNNLGKRKNLSITALIRKDSTKFSTTKNLDFEYADQLDFSNKPLRHNFDCETMIVQQNKIHLFTKEWKSKKTSHYIIDQSKKEKQVLTKTEEFNLQYLATDGYYFDNKLYLIGYTKTGRIFLTIFECDENLKISDSKFKKYKLGSALRFGQVEGITINTNGIYISAEGFNKFIFNAKPSLYFIPFSDL
ncbi:MAG: hypothetical protein QM535_04260 [Limnohabitans sp.]|nr:hypothetical protein [Limnohabitans sp.]